MRALGRKRVEGGEGEWGLRGGTRDAKPRTSQKCARRRVELEHVAHAAPERLLIVGDLLEGDLVDVERLVLRELDDVRWRVKAPSYDSAPPRTLVYARARARRGYACEYHNQRARDADAP